MCRIPAKSQPQKYLDRLYFTATIKQFSQCNAFFCIFLDHDYADILAIYKKNSLVDCTFSEYVRTVKGCWRHDTDCVRNDSYFGFQARNIREQNWLQYVFCGASTQKTPKKTYSRRCVSQIRNWRPSLKLSSRKKTRNVKSQLCSGYEMCSRMVFWPQDKQQRVALPLCVTVFPQKNARALRCVNGRDKRQRP